MSATMEDTIIKDAYLSFPGEDDGSALIVIEWAGLAQNTEIVVNVTDFGFNAVQKGRIVMDVPVSESVAIQRLRTCHNFTITEVLAGRTVDDDQFTVHMNVRRGE